MAHPLHCARAERSSQGAFEMKLTNAVVTTAFAMVMYSTTSLVVPTQVMRNPTCCVDPGDCPTGEECDYSEGCGELPGRCYVPLGRPGTPNGV
jgi:hypothetical protein